MRTSVQLALTPCAPFRSAASSWGFLNYLIDYIISRRSDIIAMIVISLVGWPTLVKFFLKP